MKYSFLLIALIASVVVAEKYGMVFGAKDGWSNYSITSNPCRAYDDMIKAGIKPENIIFMAYSTDLTSKSNPYPGMIFTDPADNTDGDWAKYGCFDHLDYTDKDINAKVFLAVLSGDLETAKKETGKENPKVLAAGPDDTVFTYFIDHGGDDIICVGNDYVHSKELIAAFQTAYENKRYGKWVFFMEACHSGSMFPKLPEDWNIYVMTSSDAHHNAYMSNCPPEDVVAGKSIKACMSGLWDNSYMQYSEDHPETTIGEIVDFVKKDVAKTSNQNVSEFGDKTFRDYKLSDFLGEIPKNRMRKEVREVKGIVDVAEVPLHLAKWRAIRATEDKEAALKEYAEMAVLAAKREVEVMRLGRALMNEKAADAAMKNAAETYSIDCVRDLSMQLIKKCGHETPFTASTNNMLRNICLPGLSVPNVDFDEICM